MGDKDDGFEITLFRKKIICKIRILKLENYRSDKWTDRRRSDGQKKLVYIQIFYCGGLGRVIHYQEPSNIALTNKNN